jgi:PIN domain nuclease of toxin-antitoxin system
VKLLLDAHTLIWAVDDPSKLSARAAAELRNMGNDLLLGAGTLWEMSIKVGLGKLHLSQPFRRWMTQAVADLGLTVMPITIEAADVQAALPFHHKDPFDRLLASQAIVDSIAVVSADAQLDAYGANRIG